MFRDNTFFFIIIIILFIFFLQNFTSSGNYSDVSMSQSAVLDDLAKYSHYTLWVTASTAFGDGNKTSEIIDVYTDQDSK